MDKAYAFGRNTITFKFTTGFGLYVESIPLHVRPALVQYDPDSDELDTCFVEYSATVLKLPLMSIELGRYNTVSVSEQDRLELNELIDLMKQDLEDDDEK